MAENLDDGEFWLPPQFLDDDHEDDKTMSFPSNDMLLHNVHDTSFHFVSFGSFAAAPCSDLSSPFGGYSEAESDEDEHIQRVAELNHQFSESSLDSDSKTSKKSDGGFAHGSPQSTLCAFGCRNGSSQGSPNSVCNMCSAKATWDLLHAAAGEVERMRLSQQEEIFGFNNSNGFIVPQRNYSPPLNNNSTTTPDFGYYTQQQPLSQQQLQIAQLQMLRKYKQKQQQQIPKQQDSAWGGVKNCGGVYQPRQSNQTGPKRGRDNMPLGLSASAWPPLQQGHAKHNQHTQNKHQPQHQQYGSGFRAVFLNNPSGRRECAGTGVFLPRSADIPESRNNPVCSTVLVPARVVQALNLKLDDMVGGQPQRHFHRFNLRPNIEENAAAVPRFRSNYYVEKQKNIRSQPTLNSEIMLPQEWTY